MATTRAGSCGHRQRNLPTYSMPTTFLSTTPLFTRREAGRLSTSTGVLWGGRRREKKEKREEKRLPLACEGRDRPGKAIERKHPFFAGLFSFFKNLFGTFHCGEWGLGSNHVGKKCQTPPVKTEKYSNWCETASERCQYKWWTFLGRLSRGHLGGRFHAPLVFVVETMGLSEC